MTDVTAKTTVDRVIVPIANPDTAKELLKLASALVDPEEGDVIALFVLSGNLELETETLDRLEPLVEELAGEEKKIKLQTHRSSSIARGILDASRDTGSDLIILGAQRAENNQELLGIVVENVLAAISCPVLIYRPAFKEQETKRIVVPTDGTVPARTASAIGIQLARYFDIEIDAVYVQPGYRSRWEGLGHIEQSLEDIPGSAQVKRTLITAQNPAQGTLARLNDDDLLVVGYSARSEIERWLFGDFSRKMLMHARCAVILVSPTTPPAPLFNAARKSINRLILRLTPAEEEDIVRQAYDLSAANLDYLVLIAISALIASLGLLANSVAVIIGAMLVAPFMQPCIAFAVGMATNQIALVRRALLTLLVGIPLALGIAALTGLLVRGQPFTSEMIARGNPTLLDVMVAFASGVMGAYATARKDIPSALAGVAIAAALMPPLCTFGIGLTAGNVSLGLHAGLLFLTNIVCIGVIAWLVFYLVGLRPILNGRIQRFSYGSMVMLSVLVLLTIGLLVNFSAATNRSQQVAHLLDNAFSPAETSEIDVQDGSPIKVTVVVRSAAPITTNQVSAVEEMLANRLSSPVHLDVIFQQIISSQ
ncbi:MAG: DUF389 domain-containing protein [Anaerolineaceae bacterium]|nr:DUF389 domain-containing protein [Anaerolineaceae bacterium]